MKILTREAEETVIEVDGVKITIPTHLFDQEGINIVCVGRSSVYVFFNDGSQLVMPRDDPHFRLSIDVGPSVPRGAGDLTVSKQADGYHLADFGNRRLLKYTSSTVCPPVALYNGVVWLLREQSMIPTFIDIKTPEKLYFRSDRAIKGMGFHAKSCAQGSKARGVAQFVVGLADIVDLVGGSVTSISRHYGYPDNCRCFVGFNKGKFQAWVIHEDEFSIDDLL
ncbi:hypothetical protein CJU90_3649 [Yarrowia sp. C11]|nr:hypothetical protein CKK34_5260 [Yarrowia sp. E02]KAG5367363.1 hypothetical protein CJU90_3649 [Yarrowia sp. C11]